MISKIALQKIRKILEKNSTFLALSVLGKSSFSKEELAQFKKDGLNINDSSLLEFIYKYNLSGRSVKSLKEILELDVELDEKSRLIVEQSELAIKSMMEKLNQDLTQKAFSIITQENLNVINGALKKDSQGEIIQKLKALSKDGNRDWGRIASTEMSNLIGQGSVRKIEIDNKGKSSDEIYVYRIPVNDSITCKWCRKFYGNGGETPKIYKLSTLIGNGSNYGKNQAEWLPVTGATHPNTRTSPIVQVSPGYKVTPGGSLTFIGYDKWEDWIKENLEA